jgi:hypothetical protein
MPGPDGSFLVPDSGNGKDDRLGHECLHSPRITAIVITVGNSSEPRSRPEIVNIRYGSQRLPGDVARIERKRNPGRSPKPPHYVAFAMPAPNTELGILHCRPRASRGKIEGCESRSYLLPRT